MILKLYPSKPISYSKPLGTPEMLYKTPPKGVYELWDRVSEEWTTYPIHPTSCHSQPIHIYTCSSHSWTPFKSGFLPNATSKGCPLPPLLLSYSTNIQHVMPLCPIKTSEDCWHAAVLKLVLQWFNFVVQWLQHAVVCLLEQGHPQVCISAPNYNTCEMWASMWYQEHTSLL